MNKLLAAEKKMQKSYITWRALAEVTTKIGKLWETSPESEGIEKRFDEAYKAEMQEYKKLIDMVKQLTKVDTVTARGMIHSEKFAKLMNATIVA